MFVPMPVLAMQEPSVVMARATVASRVLVVVAAVPAMAQHAVTVRLHPALRLLHPETTILEVPAAATSVVPAAVLPTTIASTLPAHLFIAPVAIVVPAAHHRVVATSAVVAVEVAAVAAASEAAQEVAAADNTNHVYL